MKCPSCQSDNPPDSRFCGNCGFELKEDSPTLSYSPAEEAMVGEALGFKPGEKFGERYTIIEEIGRGGMGRVYKAEDHELGITVVLKMIRPDLSSRPHMVEQFRKETLLGRSISHENVVRIHDLGEVNKIKYISMDFIKGENLLELIQTSGTLSFSTCLQIAVQVCRALKAAHQKGIIHQDLKPQNIMIDNSGRVFVTDFGLAKSVSATQARPTDKHYGTPKYFSPEQARGQESDQRSDIYSLGVILFEMTTGTAPFEADTVQGYIQKHTGEKPPLPTRINPSIPPACEKIILKCLEKKSENRYQSVDELLRDLEFQKTQGHASGEALKIKKRRTAVLAAVVILLLGTALYKILVRPHPPPSGRVPIAVLYAVNNSGDKSLDDYLRWTIPYYLSIDLAQSKYLSVLPQDRLMQVLSDLHQLDEAHHLSKTLDRVADIAGVEYFILPSFTKVGNSIWISFTVRKAQTDETLGEPDIVKGEKLEDLFPMVEDVSLKVKSRLNLSPDEIAGDYNQTLDKLTTTKPEALRHYVEAEKSHVRRDYMAGVQSLEKAVEEDPDFAMAYLKMAVNYEYLGDYSKNRTYLQKAMTLVDRVSERDRYLIQGYSYYALDESPLRAIESYQKLIELYPDEEAYTLLGAIRRNFEEWDLALEQFEKILAFNPKNELALENKVFIYTAKGWYESAVGLCEAGLKASSDGAFFVRQLPLLDLIQGRYDRASAGLETALARLPDNFDILELEGNLHHLRGDFAGAQRVYEQLQRRGEAALDSLDLRGRTWLAHLHLSQGEYRQAQEEIVKGIELAQKSRRIYDEIEQGLLLAWSELQLRRFSKAAEALKPLLKMFEGDIGIGTKRTVMHMSGLASLGLGRIEEAKTAGLQVRQLIERESFPKKMRYYEHLMGQIGLAEGRTDQAIRHFEQAISLLPQQRENTDEQALYYDGLAAAFYQSGDLVKAMETYKTIVSLTTGRLLWGDIYARGLYWLGKIHQRNGNRTEAAAQYDIFLQLWKNADGDIPEVVDARKQLATLKKVP